MPFEGRQTESEDDGETARDGDGVLPCERTTGVHDDDRGDDEGRRRTCLNGKVVDHGAQEPIHLRLLAVVSAAQRFAANLRGLHTAEYQNTKLAEDSDAAGRVRLSGGVGRPF